MKEINTNFTQLCHPPNIPNLLLPYTNVANHVLFCYFSKISESCTLNLKQSSGKEEEKISKEGVFGGEFKKKNPSLWNPHVTRFQEFRKLICVLHLLANKAGILKGNCGVGGQFTGY